MTVAVAVLVATACTTEMLSPERKAERASGARIQMGEGHLNREGRAFHYWDKKKEIPAVCARCQGRQPMMLDPGQSSARRER